MRSIDELVILYGAAVFWGGGLGISLAALFPSRSPIVIPGAPDVTFATGHPNFAVGFLSGVGLAAAGATAVALVDRGERLRYGVAHSAATGLFVGFEAGLFTGLLTGPISSYGRNAAGAGLMWGSSAAGAVVGGIVGRSIGTTPGRASLVLSGAIWGGTVVGFATGGVVGFATGGTGITGEKVQKGVAIGGLLGTGAGAIGAGLLAARISPTIERVRFIDLASIGGGVLGLGIAAAVGELTKGEDIKTGPSFLTTGILLGSAVGTGVGLGVGTFLTRGMDGDEPRRRASGASFVPLLSPVAGGATVGAVGSF